MPRGADIAAVEHLPSRVLRLTPGWQAMAEIETVNTSLQPFRSRISGRLRMYALITDLPARHDGFHHGRIWVETATTYNSGTTTQLWGQLEWTRF
jgi:hypothetical protein